MNNVCFLKMIQYGDRNYIVPSGKTNKSKRMFCLHRRKNSTVNYGGATAPVGKLTRVHFGVSRSTASMTVHSPGSSGKLVELLP